MFHARALLHVYGDSIRWSDHIDLLYIALRIKKSLDAFSGVIACGICPLYYCFRWQLLLVVFVWVKVVVVG